MLRFIYPFYRYIPPCIISGATLLASEEKVEFLGVSEVTGDKARVSMEDEKQSASIFDSHDLGDSSLQYFHILENVAGGYGGNPTSGNFTLRGWKQDNTFGGVFTGVNSKISTEKHGISQSAFTLRFLPPTLWDVDTVAIFRGPQPLHYGANSIGGRLSFHYKEPDFSYEGKLKSEYASRSTFRNAFTQNIPLVEGKLALRFNYENELSDGSVTNVTLSDSNYGQYDTHRFRSQLLWHPNGSKDSKLLLVTEYNQVRGNPHGHVKEFAGSGFFDRATDENFAASLPANQWLMSLIFDHKINDQLSLHSVTGSNLFSHKQFTDLDFGPTLPFTVELAQSNKHFSHASYLTSDSDKLSWQAGAYLSYADSDIDVFGNGFTSPVTTPFESHARETNQSYAVHGSLERKLAEHWEFHAGLRVQHDRVTKRNRAIFNNTPVGSAHNEYSETVLLPSVGIAWKPNEQHTSGLKITKGYRPGGVSYAPFLGRSRPYQSESSWEIEWYNRHELGRKVHLLTNVFYTQLSDQQVPADVPGGVPRFDQQLLNSGKSRRLGAEAEVDWQASEHWRLRGTVGYISTKFESLSLNGVNRDGQSFPFAPKWTCSASASYDRGRGIFGNINFSWADRSYDRIEDPQATSLEIRRQLSAKVGWKNDRMKIYVFAENLLDDDFAYSRGRYSAFSPELRGKASEPRLVGIGAEFSW